MNSSSLEEKETSKGAGFLPKFFVTICFLLLPSRKALSILGAFPQSVQNSKLERYNHCLHYAVLAVDFIKNVICVHRKSAHSKIVYSTLRIRLG